MADRVKYFLLGVLFLVVAGVIAYDRWNSAGAPREDVAERRDMDTGGDFKLDSARPGPDLAVEPPATGPDQGERKPVDQKPTPDPVREEPVPTQKPPVKEQPPRVEPKPEPLPAPDKTHVVKKGETLERIAIQYYGTRDGVEWIADANRLGNRNRININQKLVIPARKEITKEGASGGKKVPAKIPSRYTVKEGDGDLYAICRRLYGGDGLGARVWRVMEMNHLHDKDVKAGTVLLLPQR